MALTASDIRKIFQKLRFRSFPDKNE